MAINIGQMLLQGPNSGTYTPETLERKRQMAQAMLKGGMGIQDIRHPLQGLAQMLQAGVGGYHSRMADEEEARKREEANARIGQLLSGGMDAPMGDLTSAVGDPWASDAQQQMAMMLLGEQIKKQNAPPPQPDWQTLTDNGDTYRWNAADPNSRPELFFDGSEPAVDAPTLKTIFDPATGREQTVQWNGADWEPIGGVQAPKDPLVQVNTGDQTGGSGDFYKGMDADLGEQQAALIDAGRNAVSNNMRLGELERLLGTAPQGAVGSFVQMAGQFGIPMEGLSEVQAAQAIINQMVPGQRPPGSGTMSDADLALFKQSLPSIANQPGGNLLILQTAKAINEYTIRQAEIAQKIANREISPAEGRALQAAIPNPLADFNGAGTGSPNSPKAPPVGTVEDGYRFKGGDPADPNNWEQVQSQIKVPF